jgi:copper chaperone CopZ
MCFQALLVIVAVLAGSASVAFAQDSSSPQPAAAWMSVHVTAHTDLSGEIITIAGELPEVTSRPATVELAVPAGSRLRWIGEILGGDPTADPEVDYEVITTVDSDVYRFALTQSHTGQVEVIPPQPVTTFDGSEYSAKLEWTARQAVPEVRLAVQLPTGAQVVQPADDAAVTPSGPGTSYYSKVFTDVSAEESLSLDFTFTAPQGVVSSQDGPTSSGGDPAGAMWLIVGIGLGAFGTGVWRKMRSRRDAAERPKGEPQQLSEARLPEESASRPAVAPRLSPRVKLALAAAGIVGGAIAFMIVVNGDVGTVRTTEAGITKVMTSAQANQVTRVPASLQAGGDVQHESGHVFEALEGIAGIGAVSVSADGSTIEVAYDSSEVSEESIVAVLRNAGYTPAIPSSASE